MAERETLCLERFSKTETTGERIHFATDKYGISGRSVRARIGNIGNALRRVLLSSIEGAASPRSTIEGDAPRVPVDSRVGRTTATDIIFT